ncbi:MAG: potassium transporter TrkH, partial [Pseudomonadota bacterium]|nr:potassium transporter TrkH [Pseudomonadota bacterium]
MANLAVRMSWSPPYLRPILYLIGGMLVTLSIAMIVPAIVDWAVGNPDWKAFALGSAVTLACGIGLVRGARCRLSGGLTVRQAFALTPISWASIALFGAMPLYFSDYAQLRDSFTNAVFESVSGLTTTGATVIAGLDAAPPGVLLWRAILQWIGGIGIIATAIAILPALGVGGMQLFRTESSDRSEKVMPRVREIAMTIVLIYVGFTVACAAAYWLAGMSAFDAVAHALTTISTAGFSTSDASLGNWPNPAIHWIAVVGMVAGALPFVLYVRLLQGQRDSLRDSQARVFLVFIAVVIGLVALWLVATGRYGAAEAVRQAAF